MDEAELVDVFLRAADEAGGGYIDDASDGWETHPGRTHRPKPERGTEVVLDGTFDVLAGVRAVMRAAQ